MALVIAFSFTDILEWVGGFIAICLFCGFCYLIGLIGLKIRTGVKTVRYLNKVETEAKKEGQWLNSEGIALRKKGMRMIFIPLAAIILFYAAIFLFVPKYPEYSLVLMIPVMLGFFRIFFVPEQFAD